MNPIGKRPGCPSAETHAADEVVLRDWKTAQAGGMSRREFAAQREISPEELERTVQRASKRLAKERRQT